MLTPDKWAKIDIDTFRATSQDGERVSLGVPRWAASQHQCKVTSTRWYSIAPSSTPSVRCGTEKGLTQRSYRPLRCHKRWRWFLWETFFRQHQSVLNLSRMCSITRGSPSRSGSSRRVGITLIVRGCKQRVQETKVIYQQTCCLGPWRLGYLR
ncbi:hypothetical protein BU25DRAFT_26553 [Macroventuria anomochaeta]|uniref:Uncharacterized protein n=1 Tax=Macroventuria anomochaeta TaxID=301207 RepID=A0ACB6S545_9PLEO|nr:uncharacterized protein BU25DRAFT_26553 [Macroventuria anomochaeta]KAF2629083.1 hypothetical protein BU25DRAFT_26553 [Macroventuria anomochaeta]